MKGQLIVRKFNSGEIQFCSIQSKSDLLDEVIGSFSTGPSAVDQLCWISLIFLDRFKEGFPQGT
jgi:hypothetical protein